MLDFFLLFPNQTDFIVKSKAGGPGACCFVISPRREWKSNLPINGGGSSCSGSFSQPSAANQDKNRWALAASLARVINGWSEKPIASGRMHLEKAVTWSGNDENLRVQPLTVHAVILDY